MQELDAGMDIRRTIWETKYESFVSIKEEMITKIKTEIQTKFTQFEGFTSEQREYFFEVFGQLDFGGKGMDIAGMEDMFMKHFNLAAGSEVVA